MRRSSSSRSRRPHRPLLLAAALLTINGCDDGGDGGTGGPSAPLSCEPPAAERPTVARPTFADREYLVELDRWGISNDDTSPVETTDGINAALEWAASEGYGRVRLPTGHYRIGKRLFDHYTGGIVMQDDLALVMDDETVLQMEPNDTWAYCAIAIDGLRNVGVYGGTIRGDRDAHTYGGTMTHEDGHCICIGHESELVEIAGVKMEDPTGDGVAIVAEGGPGSTCRDITIRDSEIARGRRQGISIVGGTNVWIENNEIHHVEGTAPQFGIDIESLSFVSRDIVIRRNRFHHNRGGDFVNTDGRNVWFEENHLDQTGLEGAQTDGPFVHWSNTDQVVRGNTFVVTVGSSNGRWAVIGYSGEGFVRTNPAANVFEDNTFVGGGLHMMHNSLFHVRRNTFEDFMILGYRISCLRLEDNEVENAGETYKFREVRGLASGNLRNGEPIDLAMSDDEEFTNSPPHLW